jgi:cytochrome c556
MKRLTLISLAIATAALTACADNTPGGKAAHERHENFEAIGEAFDTIADQVKDGKPDMAKVKPAADEIARLSPQIPQWFPAGSGPQDGKSTDALAAAWEKPEELRALAAKFDEAVKQLKAAADAGDPAALAAAVKAAGGTCKNCHDKFRED